LTNSYSQVVFEKGYFVNNQNEKIECWIKNQDWINQPKQIEYKLSEDGNTEVTDFNQINSFQVYNTPHYYKKQVVNIDREKNSEGFNPKLEPVILKVLVEGKASLYEDISTGLFFYKNENEEIKQLIFKRYESKDSKIIEDFSYRTELYNNVKCRDNSAEKLRKINYKQNSLVNYFTDYNQCVNNDFKNYTENQTKFLYNLKAIAGTAINTNMKTEINFFPSEHNASIKHTNSDISVNAIIGAEFEMLLPFNKNKWGIFISPTFQSYKNESSTIYNDFMGRYYMISTIPSQGPVNTYFSYTLKIEREHKYTFIEVPIGIRYYFNVNEKNKFFINASYGFILNLSTTENVSFETLASHPILPPLRIENTNSKASGSTKFGVGYVVNSKLSISANYSILQLSQSNIVGFSLQASYRFL
ncbi:MAG: hypothetical protein CVU07_12265, partial [Bacteroidetes bacterium HGW-Bacteroidetes-23]